MMILNSLVIENIRSYVHQEIEFQHGVSLFEGDIGSGKSTILMAIEFALFGLGSQKPEALLAKKESTGYAILEFSVDGCRYEIKRTLKRTDQGINQNPKETWIKTEGTKEPLSPSDLKQRILQILRFNESPNPRAESRIFRYAIFTPQEAMKNVLDDAGRRLETIRKAFQIEEYSTAESNARVLLSYIRTEARVMQDRFGNIPEMESQMEKSKTLIDTICDQVSKEEAQMRALADNIESAQAALRKLQNKKNDKIRLESDIDSLKDKISHNTVRIGQLRQEVARSNTDLDSATREYETLSKTERPDTTKSVTELASEIKKFQRIREDRIRLESEKDIITGEISKIQDGLGSMDSSLESSNSLLDSLQKKKRSCDDAEQEIRGSLDDVRSQKTRTQTGKNALKVEIGKFVKLGNKCPTCDQTIDEQHSHQMIDDKQKKVLELDGELASITDVLSELNSRLNNTLEMRSSYEQEIIRIQDVIRMIKIRDEKMAKIPSIDAGIRMFNLQYSEFQGGNPVDVLTDLKDALIRHYNATETIQRIDTARQKTEMFITRCREEIESATSQNLDWESELNQKRSDLESFEDVDDAILQKETDLDKLRRNYNTVSNDITAGQTRIQNEKAKLEQDTTRLAESKMWKSKHQKFSQFQEWLEEFFIPTTAYIEKQVMLSILQRFNETYHDWYSVLVDDPTKESRIDENFTPIIDQDGIDQDVAFLSGGEKTSIALAYRLTLNSLVREEGSIKSNLLILDEPTDGFSKNQLYKVRQILDDLESEQIILVSHDPELETCADHVFRISKQDGISRVQSMNPG